MTARHNTRDVPARRLLLLLCASAWACGTGPADPVGSAPADGPSSPASPPPPAEPSPSPEESPIGLLISPEGETIDPGETLQLHATLIAEDSTETVAHELLWSTTDPEIATVSSEGLVTGIGGGIVHVIGRSGDLTASARITVRLYLSQISVGDMHTCGLSAGGAAFCWGGNAHGELGTGDYTSRAMPAPAARGYELAMIAAAGGFTCGVTTSGVGYCWGDDSMMELGESQVGKTSSVPVPIAGGLTLQQVSGSQMAHACGLETDGTAWCWGYNRFGMVGHGVLRDEPEPVAVAGGLVFGDLHSSYFRTCGVETSGDIYCWGRGGPAQIGDPDAGMDTCGGLECALSPMRSASPEVFLRVSVSRSHSCALTADANTYCWGSNESGQLGTGNHQDADVPTRVNLPLPVTMVATGRAHSCALLTDGQAYCWGDNMQGQLGTATWSSSDTPQPVAGNLHFTSLVAGYHQTCALTIAGEAYCWGRNEELQLGVGEDSYYNAPALIQFE